MTSERHECHCTQLNKPNHDSDEQHQDYGIKAGKYNEASIIKLWHAISVGKSAVLTFRLDWTHQGLQLIRAHGRS